jgi:hypothetical protein
VSPRAAAEPEELAWLEDGRHPEPLALLLREKVLPALREHLAD